jgi:hypothetical protein
MSPTSHTPKSRRRSSDLKGRAAASGARDLVEALGRYYDKVERDSVGNLVATCNRCRVVDVIAWPDDERYVLGCLRHAHENHNHAAVRP